MLDFIYFGSADLFGTGSDRKIQNENMCFERDSNPHHASPQQESQCHRPLGHAGSISSRAQKGQKGKVTTHTTLQKVRFHSGCGATKDSHLE